MLNFNKKDIDFMKQASLLCDNAECGYKVGCIVVVDSKIICKAWNMRLEGNTFCNFGTCIREVENLAGGKSIDKVCSIHAEQFAIAMSAKKGVSLAESTMYLTTFPCLICAKSIVVAGIKKLFYMSPYMGEDYSTPILAAANVSVINIPQSVCWGE